VTQFAENPAAEPPAAGPDPEQADADPATDGATDRATDGGAERDAVDREAGSQELRLPRELVRLLETERPGVDIQWAVRSGARADTGWWWVASRVWAVVTDEQLLVAAIGPRPRLDGLDWATLVGARYNPLTRELLLPGEAEPPGEGPAPRAPRLAPPPRKLRLDPEQAERLLDEIARRAVAAGVRRRPIAESLGAQPPRSAPARPSAATRGTTQEQACSSS